MGLLWELPFSSTCLGFYYYGGGLPSLPDVKIKQNIYKSRYLMHICAYMGPAVRAWLHGVAQQQGLGFQHGPKLQAAPCPCLMKNGCGRADGCSSSFLPPHRPVGPPGLGEASLFPC